MTNHGGEYVLSSTGQSRYVQEEVGVHLERGRAPMSPAPAARQPDAHRSFLPADVQANLGSPAFGSLYNSVYREYRIRIRVEK